MYRFFFLLRKYRCILCSTNTWSDLHLLPSASLRAVAADPGAAVAAAAAGFGPCRDDLQRFARRGREQEVLREG